MMGDSVRRCADRQPGTTGTAGTPVRHPAPKPLYTRKVRLHLSRSNGPGGGGGAHGHVPYSPASPWPRPGKHNSAERLEGC